ncbi:MAG: hypothetical protein Kow00121_25610 [Elainellaceae cyanobacterium]
MNTHPFSRNHRTRLGRSSRTITTRAQSTIPHAHRDCKSELRKSHASGYSDAGSLKAPQAEQNFLLRQQALSAAQQGNHVAAIALFSELILNNPSNASDYSNRGLVYFQNGQIEAALEDYNRAIGLNPRLDSAYNNRANYYAAQGQFLEAILDYDIALDLNPTNVRAWINQGITFRELEMYDRALESFDLALCLGKLEGHIYAERGRTYHLRGDWNCAIADYQRALVELPDTSSSLKNPSVRLYHQVEVWMDKLLSPLRP